MKTLPKALPKFFWHFLRPYTKYLLWMIVAGVFWAIHTSLIPYMLKLIVNGVASHAGPLKTVFVSIWIPVSVFLFSFIVMAGIYRLRDYCLAKIIPPIKRDMGYQVFSYLQDHAYHYFQNHSSGSLANKINDMTRGASNVIESSQIFFENFSVLLVGSLCMYMVRPIFAFALLGWGLSFLGISFIFSKKSHRLAKILSDTSTRLTSKIVDGIANIINARLFARERYERDYLDHYLKETKTKEQDLIYYMMFVKVIQDVAIISLLCGMMTLLVWHYKRGLVTVGDFAFILTLSISIFQIIWYLAAQFVEFSEQLGVCGQSLEMINVDHEIEDDPKALPLHIAKGEITFKNVDFHYLPEKPIFTGLEVEIPAGQKVGLVGFSGSGKTTFLHLILRLFEISNGSLLIDGQDIRRVTKESLHEQIAMIPQDPFLFHRTLMENIRYGRLGATDEEVIEASKKAHCHEFIQQLKDGYESVVGERGMKLSGGQRQRIAIARAILKNAPILMLDEATSALDSVTERYIQESLYYLMKDRTTLVVAHRLSTLANMDRILVFKDKRIVEDGSHGALMAYNDHYAKLWNMQAGGFLPNKPTANVLL